eukprot:2858337-Amphidinium_carterae.1
MNSSRFTYRQSGSALSLDVSGWFPGLDREFMTRLHTSVLRLSYCECPYEAVWAELQSLKKVVGRKEVARRGEATEGAIMGWDAALDTIAHATDPHGDGGDSQPICRCQKTLLVGYGTNRRVLGRAGPIGDNQPNALLGSHCKFGAVADPRRAIDLLMLKLQEEYYPRLGA